MNDNNNNYYEPHVDFDFESIYAKEEQPEEVDYESCLWTIFEFSLIPL